MSQLPQWATDALAAAGLSSEGLAYDPHNDAVEYSTPHATCTLTVTRSGGVILEDLAYGLTGRSKYAFQLAKRLAAALKGEPDPLIKELEAEVARLREACNAENAMRRGHEASMDLKDAEIERLNGVVDEVFSYLEPKLVEWEDNGIPQVALVNHDIDIAFGIGEHPRICEEARRRIAALTPERTGQETGAEGCKS